MNEKKYLFLEYPQCSTCKKAKKWLEEKGVDFEDRNIKNDNPSKEELSAWLKLSGDTINKFFNTSGKIYKENNLKDKVKTATDDELLDLLASDGMLVKRPIVVTSTFVLIGFKEKDWAENIE